MTNSNYRKGEILRLRERVDNPTALIGKLVYFVRASNRTDNLTVAMVEPGAGYDKDETLHVHSYQVERVETTVARTAREI